MEQLTNVIETNFSRVFRELAELRQEIARLSPGSTAPPAGKESVPEPKIQPEVKPVAELSFHQRTGNYKPEDVAIEKFFYAGQR